MKKIVSGSVSIRVALKTIIRINSRRAGSSRKRRVAMNRCEVRREFTWSDLGEGKNFTVDYDTGKTTLLNVNATKDSPQMFWYGRTVFPVNEGAL